ncbi:MAG: hypothetical protein RI967_1893 [Planctomycetota bacterium]
MHATDECGRRVASQPALPPVSDDLLIHIGYHKAASTWLQRTLFAPSSERFAPVLGLEATLDRFVRPHALEWRAGGAILELAAAVEAARARGRTPVLSCEELSGNPHAGGMASAEIAARLARVAPAARILVVVRRQPDAIASTYRQFVRRGGTLSARRYLAERRGHFRMPGFRADHWRYDLLVERYRALFGGARVKVLPFEALAADPARFAAEIAAFAGTAPPATLSPLVENRGSSALATAILRRTNRLFMRDDVNPGAPLRWWRVSHAVQAADRAVLARLSGWHESRLARAVEEVCAGRYEESNARLAAMTGVDLARFGYAIAEARSTASIAR